MFTSAQVWEALDEVDSTGELYNEPELESHLVKEHLIRVDLEDEGYEMTEKGKDFYSQGHPGR